MAGTGDWQLYDLSADPGEIRDLAAERPDKLAELLAAWDRYVEEAGVLLGPNTIFELPSPDRPAEDGLRRRRRSATSAL